MHLTSLSSSLTRQTLPFSFARSMSARLFSTSSSKLFPEEVNLIFDSKCGICNLEMTWLANRDSKINPTSPKILLTDIESPSYNPSDPKNGGVTYREGMSSIRAVTSNGEIIKGMPVFALAYNKVGLGWLFALTTYPVIKELCDLGYVFFAKYRTLVTRGEGLDSLVKVYEERMVLEGRMKEEECESGRCKAKE